MPRVESFCKEGCIDCFGVLDIAIEDYCLLIKGVLLVGIDCCVDVLGAFIHCTHLRLVKLACFHLKLSAVDNLSRGVGLLRAKEALLDKLWYVDAAHYVGEVVAKWVGLLGGKWSGSEADDKWIFKVLNHLGEVADVALINYHHSNVLEEVQPLVC